MGHALWLRKETTRRGYAWRQQRRARQLSSLRAACVPPCGDVGEALRYVPSGAGVSVETLRELATRGKRTSTSGKCSGEGAGARVAVRSVLEAHETAILELERQVSEVECLVNHVKILEKLLAHVQDIAFQTRDRSLTIDELGMNLETKVRDLEDFSTLVEEKQLSMAKRHDDLKEKVLHVEQQVTSLEEWGNDFTTNLNDIEARVDNLEQWGEEFAASL